jgi:hypothetical protein
MTSETVVLIVATIAGPIVSVCIAVYLQQRMQDRQNVWQERLSKKLEGERQKWELARDNSRQSFEEAWKVADRNRTTDIIATLKRIDATLVKLGG